MPEENIPIPETIDLAAFVSREAHDLKSPFNRILGFTRMVLKGMDGPLTDLQREDLTTVYENSRQAMSFVSNLIDMARLSRGEKTPEWNEYPLDEVLTEAVKAWRADFLEERVTLKMDVPPCTLRADVALLRQAIRYVLSYAAAWVKAPAEILVQAGESSGTCLLRVQSRGEKDIAAPEMELSMWGFIAGRIIALHGGEIRSAKRGDEGASFEIALPLPHPIPSP